jgi:hypothetical protein
MASGQMICCFGHCSTPLCGACVCSAGATGPVGADVCLSHLPKHIEQITRSIASCAVRSTVAYFLEVLTPNALSPTPLAALHRQ